MAIKHAAIGKVKGNRFFAVDWNDEHEVAGFESTGPITLSGDGKVILEFRPHLDFDKIRGNAGIPTTVYRGLFKGHSLPVWDDDKEELSFDLCVPNRWDGSSNITAHAYCRLAGAEDNKNFRLELAWEYYTPGIDNVPLTENLVEVQTATGAGAVEGDSYDVEFTIDYDIKTPELLEIDDELALRLRRIAATENDCADEIIIEHVGLIIIRDKLGEVLP